MPELVVDFNDPKSVADAIPQAETLIRQAEQRVAAAVEQATQARQRASDAELEIQRLKTVLLTLEQFGGSKAPSPPGAYVETSGNLTLNSRDLALKVVTIINGPTNIAEVANAMPEFSPKTVSWALWKLADEGAIQRLAHGRYAPLSYVPGRPTTNYFNVPPGMPVPSEAQIMQAVEEANAAAKAAGA